MRVHPSDVMAAWSRKKPYVAAITNEFIYTGAFVLSKAALDQRINSFVYTFYCQAAASLLLLPMALVFERKNMTSLSPMLLLKLFLCALIGITANQNLSNASITLTSAAVAAATVSSEPVFTFCLAVLFRIEHLKLRSSSGRAKLASVVLSVAGVFIIALYSGAGLRPVNHHHAFADDASTQSSSQSQATWIKGTSLMVLSSVAWSFWIILQGELLRGYPNDMLVTVTQCVFSTVQSFAIAVVAERDLSEWKLQLDVSLLAILYNGFMVSGASYYLQVWCAKMKGPVFVAMWSPICFVSTIVCSSFFLGEIIHLGSIIGGILVLGGLYGMLWGERKEPKIVPHGDGDDLDMSNDDDVQDEKVIHQTPEEKDKPTLASVDEQV